MERDTGHTDNTNKDLKGRKKERYETRPIKDNSLM